MLEEEVRGEREVLRQSNSSSHMPVY